MSRLRANQITNENANGAPNFPHGLTVTGVVTSSTISTSIVGNLTVSGNIGVGGTLTYEDVTNVDSIGIVTARSGIKIGPSAGVAGTFFADGSYITAGIVTATNFVGGGANLTNLPAQVAIANNADNRVITGGSGVNLNGESALTFDGTLLKLQVDSGEFRVEAANGTDAFSVDSDNGNTIIGGSGTLTISDTIVHAGDTDTKIRFPSADRITFETGGSEKFKIDGNGQIIFTNSIIAERYHNDTGGGITGDYNHDVMTYGLMFYGATNAAGAFTFNLRGNGSNTFEAITNTGTTTAFTIAQRVNNSSRYLTAFKIDGSTQTVEWNGGSAPSAGGSAGVDVYTFQIMKTGSSAYVVLGNYANFD